MTGHMPNGSPDPDADQAEQPPTTESSGQLVPPPRKPPTAIATFASQPEPRPPLPVRRWRSPAGSSDLERAIVRTVDDVLDVLDEVGDAVRETALRLMR